jgi:hypothetical protein
MGALTTYLQHEFARCCPPGWQVHPEGRLLPPETERLLGYAARADVVLEAPDGGRRLWIEFEVSRADPVANHAKFATSHLFRPQGASECFLAMVSPHVTRGRRNLAFNAVALMREVGMQAFQTVLFPDLAPGEVQRLNQLPVAALAGAGLDVGREVERALAVTEPMARVCEHAIHLAGDLLGVPLNLRRWNADLATEAGRRLWGRRTVTYFVYDASSGQFAPSKFCAYAAVPERGRLREGIRQEAALGTMTVALYAALNDGSHRFDGHRAQQHLTRGLGMTALNVGEMPPLDARFAQWRSHHADGIVIHPDGPVFLLNPTWFG